MAKKDMPPETPAPANPFVEEPTGTILSEPWTGAPIGEAAELVPELTTEQVAELSEFGALLRTEVEPDAAEVKSVEAWNAELATEPWQFAAAKVVAAWPAGREVTRAEFEAAIATASGLVSR